MGTMLRLGCAMATILLAACRATPLVPIAPPADLPEDGGPRGADGGDGVSPEPFDPSPVPLDRACETWALAQCRAKARYHEFPARYVDVCVEQLIASDCFFRFEPDVVKGHVRYDEAAWGRCLARIADEAQCSLVPYGYAFLIRDADCRASFKGTLAPGEPCSSTEWCADGRCASSCVPGGQEGAACDEYWGDRDCAFHLFCQDGQCRGPGDAGDRCRSEGYADYPSWQCKPGLACASFRCTPVLEAGAACYPPGLPCETGLFCDWRTQTCVALPGPGEACEDGPEPCRHDLFCDLKRKVCLEGKGPGEWCIAGYSPRRNGCASVFQCVEDFFRNGHCGRGPGLGESCQVNGSLECESGYCHEGVCLDFSAIGLPCDEVHPCHSGVCTDGFCVDDENCKGAP